MISNIINCTKLSVNCVDNDPQDIKCDGPAYLGFDFYVDSNQSNEMKQFIIDALDAFEIPLSGIYVCENIDLPVELVWNRSTILNVISKDAQYLKDKAKHNYGR